MFPVIPTASRLARGTTAHGAQRKRHRVFTRRQYAYVAGRADIVVKLDEAGVDGELVIAAAKTGYLDQMANPLYEDGNVGIIMDPLTDHPRLVAATRPTPYGFPTDLQLTLDGHYLYVSYQGVRVVVKEPTFDSDGAILDPGILTKGAIFVFDAWAMNNEIQSQPRTGVAEPRGNHTTSQSRHQRLAAQRRKATECQPADDIRRIIAWMKRNR